MNHNFQHLHIHSNFSMMWGTAPVDVLAECLAKRGQAVFPLTDRNGLHGMIHHLKACETYGLKPIIGCEIVTDQEQALCLVKTQKGYQNLCEMLTQHYRDRRWRLEYALPDHHQGLVIITLNERLIETLYPEAEVYIDLHPGRIERAQKLHRRWKAPMVVTSHAYMISERAWPLHRMLRAIDLNGKLSRLPADQVVSRESCLYPSEIMASRFSAWPKALKATWDIAEACEFAPKLGELIFPPSDYNHAFKELRDKTYGGLVKRYGKLTSTVRERADRELDMIRRKGFSNCFLVIEDVVSRFPLTCGRGSAAASIVSYALGITHVEPIAHNLFFDRFLNPGRVDPPDIDVDFAWDERDHVRDYLWKKYGRSHIGMVCNHNRIRMRSALREIAKVNGLGKKETDEVLHRMRAARRGRSGPYQPPEPWKQILRVAQRIEDYPRHISVHCGGVVITPDQMTNHCPLKPMPIGYDVVPWDKDGVEAYGLVKLDFLGNRSLAVIRDSLAAVRENYNVAIEYADLQPVDDPQTLNMIREGDTVGCFYVESPATRQLLLKTGHGDYETLVAISSIIRPAASAISNEWVKRHRWMKEPGHKPNWKVIHPKLDETLHETHGLMVYQEDVMRAAMALAGFGSVDGDRLRKVVSKKDKEHILDDYAARFREGCREQGLGDEQIKEVWDMILSFRGYSFCKPHSASYALISFKSAFLKFHYPAEFMAAVISNQGGYYSTYAYMSYARRMGVAVLGPDINDSRACWRGYRGRIRIGFSQIKGLRRQTVADILTALEDGPFEDLSDFLYRVSTTLEEAKRLILAGCFDELEAEANRPSMIWRVLYWFARHQNQSEDLFPDHITEADLPSMEPYSERTRLLLEKRLFGFWISRHPLVVHGDRLAGIDRLSACDLNRRVGRRVVVAGWLISGKTITTKNDEPMSFLTFEDETDMYEAVLFPELFAKRATLLDHHHPYLLEGEVVSDQGAVTLNLTEMRRLE